MLNFSNCTFNNNGEVIKFGDVTDKWTTWYERLTKPRLGFSFDQSTPIIGYIDGAMRDECGDPKDNPLWTREKLRDLRDRIISDIKSKMKKDGEDSG